MTPPGSIAGLLTTIGSAVQTGLVVAAELGPYVLAEAVGGPLVDRRASFDPPATPPGAGAADQDAVTTRASTGASTRETASR
jgi:hypothetical protein